MAEPLLLTLDQGTTSSRATLHTASGQRLLSCSAPLTCRYPADGWVEQDGEEIWISQLTALQQLEQALTPEQRRAVVAAGIANQRETTLLWERQSGALLGPAIVWQDGRTAGICSHWRQEGLETLLRQRTGLLVDPYFSASKIVWLLQHQAAAASAAANGSLCFGTVDSWLLWRLSDGQCHATDRSNASRTLLMDLERGCWDPELCAALGIPLEALPELHHSGDAFTTIAAGLPFAGVPVQAVLGDQQAATLGQGCLQPGAAKCTYGTGAFLVSNTGPEIRRSSQGLLSTWGWSMPGSSPTYCLEGSLLNAGTVIQWLRDGLGLIQQTEEVNALAASVPDSGGLMLVPAFTGWGTPHWDPYARGLMIGLARDTSRGHVARAALEGIALAVATLVELAGDALNAPLQHLVTDGGAAASDPLLQAQADSTGLTVYRRSDLESTSRGVALLAGVMAGVVPGLEAWNQVPGEPPPRCFQPQLTPEQRHHWRQRWHEAVRRSLGWADQDHEHDQS
ncbi:glycerol kinase GlpK [Synechococcus sp. CCY9201]|uniref:glycerol kinase GlpK n=1 Tax=Synechococcus sp. CCY9201 TaxID=174697 RepID=UPI002B20669B|nr:glycerol kinase GlpK [Synechococcus sp. CCY9201]MEA5473401.1 glycerol kinase GlpK [Synechococcus sp. CCY9201]